MTAAASLATAVGDDVFNQPGFGGRIYNVGSVTMQGFSSMTQNLADSGGGVFNAGGTVAVTPPAAIPNNTPDDCVCC